VRISSIGFNRTSVRLKPTWMLSLIAVTSASTARAFV